MDNLIFDLQRFAKTISLTSGNDYASYNTSMLSVYALAGNDTILSSAGNVTIYGGAGNDKIQSSGNFATILGGDGADSIVSSGDNVSISGGAGNDTISISGSHKNNVIQYASGGGNDKIYNFDTSDTLNIVSTSYTSATSGNNIVFTVGTGKITLVGAKGKTINATLSSGRDNNSSVTRGKSITNNTAKNFLTGTNGNDSITNNSKGTNTTINAGAGSDKITNAAANVSIHAGTGNDYITSNGNSVTIVGGTGNDSIVVNKSAAKNLIRHYSGDGNDIVTGLDSDDTLIMSGGSFFTTIIGNDVIIGVDKGKVSLKGAAVTLTNYQATSSKTGGKFLGNAVAKKTLTGTANADTITNFSAGTRVTINGAAGNDSITNYAASVSIDAGAGNDYIHNTGNGKSLVTITGGAGNDSVYNLSDYVKIDTGAGNDSIYSHSLQSTIIGGKGNDTITRNTNSKGTNTIVYNNGDGNDLIQNITAGDTISIAGSTYSSATSGNDVIFTVGTGKITVKGAKDTAFSVKGTLKAATLPSDDAFVITNSTTLPLQIPADYRKIDASGVTNKSLNIPGNKFNNSVLSGAGNDTIYGTAGDDSLLGGAGNDNLFGDDGNDMLRGGPGNDSLTGGAGRDTLHGNDGADTLRGNEGNDVLYGEAGNDLIYGNDGDDYLYGNDGNDKIAGGAGADTITGGAGNDSLWGNAGADEFIYASGDGQDVIFGFANDDMLEIRNVLRSATYSYDSTKKEVVIGVDSTDKAIILRDFTATTFNINGTNYGISGKTLVRK